jgi:hypothetical protein
MISSNTFLVVPALYLTVFCTLLAGCDERRELFYIDLASTAKAGESARGWVPEYLPKTSRNIRLLELDSPSKEWGGFEFISADSQSFRETLKSVAVLPASVRRVPSPGKSWWPAVLKGNLDTQKIHQEGFELYIVESPADSVSTWIYLFAIDWSKGRGFFYGTRE